MPKDGTDSKKNHTSQHKQAKAQRKQKSSQIQDSHNASQHKLDKSRRWKKPQAKTKESPNYNIKIPESYTGSYNDAAIRFDDHRACSVNDDPNKSVPKIALPRLGSL